MIKKIDRILERLNTVQSMTLIECQAILDKSPLDTALIIRALSNKKALRVQGDFVVKTK